MASGLNAYWPGAISCIGTGIIPLIVSMIAGSFSSAISESSGIRPLSVIPWNDKAMSPSIASMIGFTCGAMAKTIEYIGIF